MVWVHYVSGHPPVLRSQTYDYDNPMMTQMPDKSRTKAFASGRSEGEEGTNVPEEFVTVAVMRHKEQWGEDPKVITIDEDTQGDFWSREPLRAYRARQAKERGQKLMGNPQLAPGQTYGPAPSPHSVIAQPAPDFGAKPKMPILPPSSGPLGFGSNDNT